MAVVDKRNKNESWDGGSSLLALFLSAAAAQSIFDDASAVEGWYIPSYQQQTEVGPDRDSEEVKDEADNLIKTRTNRDEFVLVTSFFQTTSSLIRLINHLEVAGNAVKLRYPMPTDVDGTSQWVLGYNVNVRKENWRLQAANEQDRIMPVTFVFTKDANGDLYEIVELPDDTTDALWADYGEFKDVPV